VVGIYQASLPISLLVFTTLVEWGDEGDILLILLTYLYVSDPPPTKKRKRTHDVPTSCPTMWKNPEDHQYASYHEEPRQPYSKNASTDPCMTSEQIQQPIDENKQLKAKLADRDSLR
jgi:hypothetical protein